MKFWMVIRASGNMAQARHETRASAEAEAQRLAVKERAEFYVLEAVSVAVPQDPPVMLFHLNGEAR